MVKNTPPTAPSDSSEQSIYLHPQIPWLSNPLLSSGRGWFCSCKTFALCFAGGKLTCTIGMTKDRVLPLPVGAETQMSLGRYPPCPIKYPLDALCRTAGITSAWTEQKWEYTLSTELMNGTKTHLGKQCFILDLFPYLCCCCYRHKRGRIKNILVEILCFFPDSFSFMSLALNTEISRSKNSAISSTQHRCYFVKYCFQLDTCLVFVLGWHWADLKPMNACLWASFIWSTKYTYKNTYYATEQRSNICQGEKWTPPVGFEVIQVCCSL